LCIFWRSIVQNSRTTYWQAKCYSYVRRFKRVRSVHFVQKIYRYKEENCIVSSGDVLVPSMIKSVKCSESCWGGNAFRKETSSTACLFTEELGLLKKVADFVLTQISVHACNSNTAPNTTLIKHFTGHFNLGFQSYGVWHCVNG